MKSGRYLIDWEYDSDDNTVLIPPDYDSDMNEIPRDYPEHYYEYASDSSQEWADCIRL